MYKPTMTHNNIIIQVTWYMYDCTLATMKVIA